MRQISRHTAVLLSISAAVAAVLPSVPSAVAAGRTSYRSQVLGPPSTLTDEVTSARHPARNIAPQPDFTASCAKSFRSRACRTQALAAIEHAHRLEGIARPRMVLPDNYNKLSVAEQTFVLTDLERVARGLKPFRGLTAALNNASHAAAVARLDTELEMSLLHLLGITEYGSVWAGDFGPLAAHYDWMFNDGYSESGSLNIACLTPSSSGCWGHRDNLIGHYHSARTLVAGVGTATPAGESISAVFTGGEGNAPKLVYTWRQARKHGAHNR